MKLALLFLGWSAFAYGTVIASFTQDSYTFTTAVASKDCPFDPITYNDRCLASGFGSDMFVIALSGVDKFALNWRSLIVAVPAAETVISSLAVYAGAESTLNGIYIYNTNDWIYTYHRSESFDIAANQAAGDQPVFLVTVRIVQTAEADTYWRDPTVPDYAQASAVVSFSHLSVYAPGYGDITSQLTWTVSEVPEPAAVVLILSAAVPYLALRRRR